MSARGTRLVPPHDHAGDSGVHLTNGVVELFVSRRFGPRILRYAFVGSENILDDVPHSPTRTSLGDWDPIGGHRLWVAPESMPGSYAPDADPVDVDRSDDGHAVFRQPTDASGIAKQLDISVAPAGTSVTIVHTITNRTYWPIRVAPWAITAVTPAATAVIPQPPYRSHDEDLLPARPLVQWSFTDLTDPRWSLGRTLIRLRSDSARPHPQKIGVGNTHGWCAAVAGSHVFLKRFAWDPDALYPDFGCNNQVYTAGSYLEVETLGALRLLHPDESASHVEQWHLFRQSLSQMAEEEQKTALDGLADAAKQS